MNTRVLSLAAILAAILVATSVHAELSPTTLAAVRPEFAPNWMLRLQV